MKVTGKRKKYILYDERSSVSKMIDLIKQQTVSILEWNEEERTVEISGSMEGNVQEDSVGDRKDDGQECKKISVGDGREDGGDEMHFGEVFNTKIDE